MIKVPRKSESRIILAFQNPQILEGVSVMTLLREIYHTHLNTHANSPIAFKKHIHQLAQDLQVEALLTDRYVNQGFSGGEKKLLEILQLNLIQPQYAILDEIDSGLDVDAIKRVTRSLQSLVTATAMGCL